MLRQDVYHMRGYPRVQWRVLPLCYRKDRAPVRQSSGHRLRHPCIRDMHRSAHADADTVTDGLSIAESTHAHPHTAAFARPRAARIADAVANSSSDARLVLAVPDARQGMVLHYADVCRAGGLRLRQVRGAGWCSSARLQMHGMR